MVSEFNPAIEKKIQRDVNGKMDIEIKDVGQTPQPKKEKGQSGMDQYNLEYSYDIQAADFTNDS